MMTTLGRWSSRSSGLAAVVCSGRNRPHYTKGQWQAPSPGGGASSPSSSPAGGADRP